MDEKYYWLGFSVFPGVGPSRFQQLLLRFQTAEEAWYAPLADLTSILGHSTASKFDSFRKDFSLSEYAQKLTNAHVSFLTLAEDEYPLLLKNIKNPPIVLFYKGNRDALVMDKKYIGVVGTRKITSYGRQVTAKLTEELVSSGCVIVSGLAMGVDAVAHKTTLDNHGITVAVLGCGVDCCSPLTNQMLYAQIIEKHGVVVSEYPLSEPPSVGSFPSRNRIIAGLSHGVVVTEGAVDSGALITAKDAIANGRKIFAVPGPITSSLSHGPNDLIKAGAKIVTNGTDILHELGIANTQSIKTAKSIVGETEEEQKIIDALLHEPLMIDDIVRRTQLGSQQTSIVLSLLEMRGLVFLQENGEYSLV